jgi:hypothetical protein
VNVKGLLERMRWGWIALGCILALATWCRIVAVEETVVDRPIRNDAAEYFFSAYNLVFQGVYSHSTARLLDPTAPLPADAYRYPGLPLVIAAFIGDWPNSSKITRNVQIVNAVSGVAAVALIFFAATSALPSCAALGTALLTAISPHLISFTVYLLTEPISVMLTSMLLAVTAVVPSNNRQALGRGPFVGIGIIGGLLSMFRPIYLLFAPFIVFALSCRHSRRKALIGVLIGTGLVVSPWFARSAISPTDEGPSSLATALLPGAYPGYILNGNPRTFPYPYTVDPGFREASANVPSVAREIARRFAADPLGMVAWYGFGKMRFLWQWDNVDGTGDVFIYPVLATPFATRAVFAFVHDVMKACHYWLIALALIGSVAVWVPAAIDLVPLRGRTVVRAASLLLAYTTIMLIPFPMFTRYAVPVFPALFMMAMVPPAMAAEIFVRRRRGVGKSEIAD